MYFIINNFVSEIKNIAQLEKHTYIYKRRYISSIIQFFLSETNIQMKKFFLSDKYLYLGSYCITRTVRFCYSIDIENKDNQDPIIFIYKYQKPMAQESI